jgi:hypothetical protein
MSVRREEGRAGRFRASAALLLAVGAVAVFLYYPTFRSSFAYDDVDYLNAAAEHLSGRTPLATVLFRPQGEHFLPALRLLIATSARLFGTDALPWRLLVFASHVVSALLLAGVARRYMPSQAVAAAAGVAFVLPAGFSSMWVWFPSGGCVSIGLVGITGAMLAIASRESLGTRRARLLATAGVLWAVAFENGLVPLVACPALLEEWERRRAPSRRGPVGLFPLFCLVLMMGSLLATSVFYRRMTGVTIEVHLLPAILRAGFLFLAAPFRLFFPGQHVPLDLGSSGGGTELLGTYGFVVLAVGTALLALLLVPRARALTTAALLSSVGAFGFVGLVALARSKVSYADLFDSDRYFFPLLVPGALLAGAAFGSLKERATGWSPLQRALVWTLVGLVLAVELPLHAFALRRRVPFGSYATHARRFGQLARLGELLSQRADSLPPGDPPLAFPDGAFYFPDVHNRRVSARFLLFVSTRHRSDRLVLGGPKANARDETILNGVLDAWSREVGEPAASFRIMDGELRDARETGAVRFGVGAFDSAIVEGFHAWEGSLRWAGPRAVLRLRATGSRLRLRLATPVTALRAGLPGFDGARVAVSLEDDTSGARHSIGMVTLSNDAIADHVLEIPPVVADAIRNRSVRLVLEGTPAWRPRDVLPGLIDERLITVQVYEAAFEDGAAPEGHSK